MEQEILAWYQFPEPEGTGYTEDMLRDPARVRELFDYCQIWYAVIYREGWDFLLQTYGPEGLYHINENSEWFADGGLEEFAQWVDYMYASALSNRKD